MLSIVEACEKGLVSGWSQSFDPIHVTQGALGMAGVAALQAHYSMNQHYVVVVDADTYKAAGKQLAEGLGNTARVVQFAEPVYASESLVEQLLAETEEDELLIAVGGGSINDVVKRASMLRGKPHICVPTALSMNGYLSPTASLLVGRKKTSLPAQLPDMLLIDWEVLSRAPERLMRSGVGDALCRVTVQSDMWLAHCLMGQDYPVHIFEAMRPCEEKLIKALAQPQEAWVEPLLTLLLLGGLAMVECGSSAPASQGEHMLAHAVHMAYGEGISPALHGEEIAVTSLHMLRLQHHLMHNVPQLHYRHPDVMLMAEHFDQPTLHVCLTDYDKKGITAERVQQMQSYIAAHWEAIHKEWLAMTVTPQQMEGWWQQAGLGEQAIDVGWRADALERLTPIASMTRGRFTFLDLVYLSA